ncbi:MAG: SCO family protein [Mariprofundaceae bacterium]
MQYKPLIFLALMLSVAIALVSLGIYQLNKMPDSQFPDFKPKFTLHSTDGTFSVKDMHGKVGLVFFGYTHCPDICPGTLVRLSQALKLLNDEERAKLEVLFITLDPARDTSEVMAKYAHYFHTKIIALSGNEEEVNVAKSSFLIASETLEANKKGNYAMNHSTYLFVLRPDGKLGNLLSHADEPNKIIETVRYWMKWAD